MGCTELTFPVPWGVIQAKCWGDSSGKPFLGLHGWLDNANTFEKLAPLLPSNVYLVAMDFPCHGRSSHRQQGIPCNRSDFIIDVKWVVSQLGWKKFSLIGHSLGAITAAFYAGTFPDEIETAILIEYRMKHLFVKDTHIVLATAAETLTSNSEKNRKTLKEFDSIEAAVDRLMEVNKDIQKDGARLLIERSVVFPVNPKSGENIWIKRDPRLKLIDGRYQASNHVLTKEMIQTLLGKIRCNILTIFGIHCNPIYNSDILAVQSDVEITKKRASYYKQYDLPGNHFIHLNNPDIVAEKIKMFLKNCELKSKL